MIRLDFFSNSIVKEGDRGKPVSSDVPNGQAVVNQRLHTCSEVTWAFALSSPGAPVFASS